MRKTTYKERMVLDWASLAIKLIVRKYSRDPTSLVEYRETKPFGPPCPKSKEWLVRDYLPDGTLRRGTLAAYFKEMRELNGKHWRRMNPDMRRKREHRRYQWEVYPLWDKLKQVKAAIRSRFPIKTQIGLAIDGWIEELEKAA